MIKASMSSGDEAPTLPIGLRYDAEYGRAAFCRLRFGPCLLLMLCVGHPQWCGLDQPTLHNVCGRRAFCLAGYVGGALRWDLAGHLSHI